MLRNCIHYAGQNALLLMRTIKQGMISRRLGIMSRADKKAIDDNLRAALSLV